VPAVRPAAAAAAAAVVFLVERDALAAQAGPGLLELA